MTDAHRLLQAHWAGRGGTHPAVCVEPDSTAGILADDDLFFLAWQLLPENWLASS